jgi:hypothetical protein
MPFPPEKTPREPTEPPAAEDAPWIIYPLLCVSLAVSPLGAPAIFLLLSWLGYCEGALGSGINCSMPLGEYFEVIGAFFELSFFLLIGFLWGILALVILFFTLHSLMFAIVRSIYALSGRSAHSWPAPALSRGPGPALLLVTWILTLLAVAVSLAS